jgi:hypothetical protein
MVKRNRKQNIEKKIKEGKGMGILANYKPWINIQDVPSLGRSTRLKGIKTNRQHEFLSDMERNYFYYLEYSDRVIDIREQFPLLPIEETILIAEELGIKHPANPKTGEEIVMTTDFLITLEDRTHIARTIKSKDDLMNKRVIEKFEIEKVFWDRQEIDWGIVTENEINKTFAKNIAESHGYWDTSSVDPFVNMSVSSIDEYVDAFITRVVDADKSLRELCDQFDKELYFEKGSALSILPHTKFDGHRVVIV